MKRTLLNTCLAAVTLTALLAISAQAADIEPPKAQLVDKFGVNMANGQVTHSLNTVSIGGLAHSVSVDTNEFHYLGYRGFRDKFLGEARNVELTTQVNITPKNILRVYDFLGSADFGYYVNGVLQDSGSNLPSGYTYQSMGDERQILEYDNTYLYWTHPDGTVSRFWRGNPSILVDVTYPNGLVITIASAGMSVTTNTGFQLKAVYVSDNRGLAVPDNPNLQNAPPANSASWAVSNPASIYGINNAYEYCTPTATTCSLTPNKWPHADFHWPGGMPRRMYLAPTNSSGDDMVWVKDAKGQQTTYYFKPYDLAYLNGSLKQGYTPNTEFSPRLVGIAPNGTTQVLTYDYRNLFSDPICLGFYGCYDYRLQSAGVTKQATKFGLTTGYDMSEPAQSPSPNVINYAYADAHGSNGVSRVEIRGNLPGSSGAMYYADTDDGRLWFEASPRNFVYEFDNANGPTANYSYTRGNLTTISYNNGDTTVVATYPADCVNTSRKTCNQATSIKDARGNYTNYTYHTPSGQVATIQYPANKDGIAAQVRYEYTQLSAHYYNGGGSKITGPPIWMKTAERTCANSNTVSGACQGGDEIVTRYEYNNDNLLMTGMTVTANGMTLRTCFQYDAYGNQIGKTEPNANLSACN